MVSRLAAAPLRPVVAGGTAWTWGGDRLGTAMASGSSANDFFFISGWFTADTGLEGHTGTMFGFFHIMASYDGVAGSGGYTGTMFDSFYILATKIGVTGSDGHTGTRFGFIYIVAPFGGVAGSGGCTGTKFNFLYILAAKIGGAGSEGHNGTTFSFIYILALCRGFNGHTGSYIFALHHGVTGLDGLVFRSTFTDTDMCFHTLAMYNIVTDLLKPAGQMHLVVMGSDDYTSTAIGPLLSASYVVVYMGTTPSFSFTCMGAALSFTSSIGGPGSARGQPFICRRGCR